VQARGNNQQTVWDRKNLARAAVNMTEERPLLGFGWDQFSRKSPDYFEQADDYPLTENISIVRVHSVALTYAADLGLIGLLLWTCALVAGVGGALTTRGPPDLMLWRAGLLATAVCYVIVTNFTPPSVFPNLSLWLLAGVVWSGRYESTREAARGGGAGGSTGARSSSARPA
jgi:O-antigen ligase